MKKSDPSKRILSQSTKQFEAYDQQAMPDLKR